jgi:hypothetical protein
VTFDGKIGIWVFVEETEPSTNPRIGWTEQWN